MKLIGLTGGVGMGKTAVQQVLLDRGVPVVDTDLLARRVVEPGQPAWGEIRRIFGPEVFDAAGQLRRDAMARRVFADAEARQQLEAITHPPIRELWRQQVAVWRRQGQPLAVVAIPLLFETAAESDFDCVVCVACSSTTQHQRLLDRGWSPDQIRQRVAAQLPIEAKMVRADYVVWTEGDKDLLNAQVARILESISYRDTGASNRPRPGSP